MKTAFQPALRADVGRAGVTSGPGALSRSIFDAGDLTDLRGDTLKLRLLFPADNAPYDGPHRRCCWVGYTVPSPAAKADTGAYVGPRWRTRPGSGEPLYLLLRLDYLFPLHMVGYPYTYPELLFF